MMLSGLRLIPFVELVFIAEIAGIMADYCWRMKTNNRTSSRDDGKDTEEDRQVLMSGEQSGFHV